MKQGFFDSIKVGSEIPPLVKNITRGQMFMYSATTWDFHPGHYDREFARSQGFKDVYVDGPMVAAFMTQLVTDWVGLEGRLKKLSVTYKAMVFPGDTLTCRGRVTNKSVSDGAKSIECEITLVNQNEVPVATGKALVSFS